MTCPACGLEAAILKSRYQAEGDESADTTTRVYAVLTFACRNKACRRFGQEIGEARHQVLPAPEEET